MIYIGLKRLGLVMTVLAATTLIGTISASPADAIAGNQGNLCAPVLCLEDANNLNGTIGLAAFNATNQSQIVHKYPDNVCNHTNAVTLNCPFTRGYGFNTHLKGARIVYFYFEDGFCLGAHNYKLHKRSYVTVAAKECPDTGGNDIGTAWVETKHKLVNVYATDFFHGLAHGKHFGPLYLCGGDTATQAVFSKPDMTCTVWHLRQH